MTESYDTVEFSAAENMQPEFSHASAPKRWQRLARNVKKNASKSEDAKGALLQAAIGREVRALRVRQGMTVMDLAVASGISVSMLSKVENGGISPSLDTLQALSSALGVPVTTLFRRFVGKSHAVLVKAGEGMDVERRGTRAGHQYKLLGYINSSISGVVVEPYLITLTEASDEFPTFHHDGMEFIHMLEGEVVYRHGASLHRMTPGDSLFFDADTPHGPKELTKLPIRFLAVISYRADQASG